MRRFVAPVLVVTLLLAVPGTAAAEREFIRAPLLQPWALDPVFPGCFIVLVGWLICFAAGGVPTPDDPPEVPTVVEVVRVVCYDGGG